MSLNVEEEKGAKFLSEVHWTCPLPIVCKLSVVTPSHTCSASSRPFHSLLFFGFGIGPKICAPRPRPASADAPRPFNWSQLQHFPYAKLWEANAIAMTDVEDDDHTA